MKSSLLVLVIFLNNFLVKGDLLAYWPFSGNAIDVTGNRNDGTVYGATLTSDRHGNSNSAYYFDGNDYIDIAQTYGLEIGSSDFSIGFWIKTTTTSNGRVYSKGSSLLSRGYMMRLHDGKIYLEGSGVWNIQFISLISNSYINTGSWTYVVGTVSNTNKVGKIYINGELDISTSIWITYDVSNGRNPEIGRNDEHDVFWEYLVGTLDDIQIYDQELSQDEIKSLYKNNCIYTYTDKGNTLYNGDSLQEGEYLSSTDGVYYLVLQYDCNVALYYTDNWYSNNELWETGTTDSGDDCWLVMQDDNNLVLYDSSDNALWKSVTYTEGTSGTGLAVMEKNSNFVVYAEYDNNIINKKNFNKKIIFSVGGNNNNNNNVYNLFINGLKKYVFEILFFLLFINIFYCIYKKYCKNFNDYRYKLIPETQTLNV